MRIFIVLSLAFLLVACADDDPQGGSAYVATWDGTPTSPDYIGGIQAPANWDIQTTQSQHNFWELFELEAVNAQHQADCGDPFHDGTGWHTFSGEYEETVYQCADHLMTFIGQGGYTALYMTPDHLLAMDSGQGTVSFDISTLAPQNRDWIDLWITPWAENLAVPIDNSGNAYQGPPPHGINIRGDVGKNGAWGGFKVDAHENGVQTKLAKTEFNWSEILPACTGPTDPSTTCGPSAKNRQTIEIVLDAAHIKVWHPASGTVWVDADLPSSVDPGLHVVTFGHHRYNAHDIKGCDSGPAAPGESCSNTWHWDNHSIDPSVQFTMIKADVRRVAGTGGTITLASPAPANAFLRFSATGTVELSVDGGPVTPAAKQPTTGPFKAHKASSYWSPIAEGATSVEITLSADGVYTGPFQAKDFGVWSLLPGAPPTPTPTPTATSTPGPCFLITSERIEQDAIVIQGPVDIGSLETVCP